MRAVTIKKIGRSHGLPIFLFCNLRGADEVYY